MPTLCPPPFTFFPSIRAERVSFTPAETVGGVGGCKMMRQITTDVLDCCYRGEKLTWPEGLCVSNSNEAGIVNLGL